MKICIIIPAYNEAKTIGEIINQVQAYTPDVLVINDGSEDATGAAARENGAVVINLEKNYGKGKALKHGFDYVLNKDYEAVITMDGDGQHFSGDLLNIIEAGQAPDVGVVVGNRMANPENMPPVRFATNLFMSFIISLVCRQNIPDTQCGLRLIKCGPLRRMRLFSSNYEIESELLIKTSRLGFKIVSVPIRSVYAGQVSLINPFVDTWRFFVMLVKILL